MRRTTAQTRRVNSVSLAKSLHPERGAAQVGLVEERRPATCAHRIRHRRPRDFASNGQPPQGQIFELAHDVIAVEALVDVLARSGKLGYFLEAVGGVAATRVRANCDQPGWRQPPVNSIGRTVISRA